MRQKPKRWLCANFKTFEETANNEKEHAKMWFKELEGIGDTAHNLAEAIER